MRGSGMLTITGANTFSGATLIEDGTLRVGDGGANGSLGTGPVIDNAYVVFATTSPLALTVLGTGELTLACSGLFTLNTPGAPSVAIHDQGHPIVAGGTVAVSAPAIMTGMPLTLTAAVADLYGECLGVSFYRDANGDGILDSGDALLASGVNNGYGYWSATISTTGWGPTTDAIFAQADFLEDSLHPPAATVAAGQLNVIADAAMIGSNPRSPVYQESGDGFSTVWTGRAYGGQYREMDGTDAEASATYTFTGLVPGNYEIWKNIVAGSQYPANVTVEVYDGDAATGTLQQTFTIDETAPENWSDWEVDGVKWSWSDNVFYSNSGTITVRILSNGQKTQVPAIRLLGGPASKSANGSCTTSSKDSIDIFIGQIQPCSCAGALPEGSLYDNTHAFFMGDTGYGFFVVDKPTMSRESTMLVTVKTSATDCPDTFLEPPPVRTYAPQYGTKATLIDKHTYLEYTDVDGSVYKFTYPEGDQFAVGQWMESSYPGGEKVKVVSWENAAGQTNSTYSSTYNKMHEVQYFASSSTTAYKSEIYDYYRGSDPKAGLAQVDHL